MADQYLCLACGTVAVPRLRNRGNSALEIILWPLIIPGIIYSVWRLFRKERLCRACRAINPIPLNSPIAQQYLAGRPMDRAPQAHLVAPTDAQSMGMHPAMPTSSVVSASAVVTEAPPGGSAHAPFSHGPLTVGAGWAVGGMVTFSGAMATTQILSDATTGLTGLGMLVGGVILLPPVMAKVRGLAPFMRSRWAPAAAFVLVIMLTSVVIAIVQPSQSASPAKNTVPAKASLTAAPKDADSGRRSGHKHRGHHAGPKG